MGCYGIGVSRVIAAIIEKHNDEKGIIWPKEIAPFQVEILPLQSGDDQTIAELAQKYLSALEQKGIEVLLDDRNESAGRKFNDADLIGIPYRITIGKKNLVNNQVEIKERATNTVSLVSKDQAVEEILKLLAK